MKIFILAGGVGSRLQSVVSDVPKPMADINGDPFLDYLIRHIRLYFDDTIRADPISNVIFTEGQPNFSAGHDFPLQITKYNCVTASAIIRFQL